MTKDASRDERADDEPGDADALPGFQTTPAEQVPPDEGDAGEDGAHVFG